MNLDLKDFVNENKHKNLIVLLDIITTKLQSLDRIKLTEENQYQIEKYKSLLHEFSVFLYGHIPTPNSSSKDFIVFIPIVKNLVMSKEIPENLLLVFE